MYNQTAASISRSPAIPFSPSVEQTPTLKDLFKGQPTETLLAGAALIWEGGRGRANFRFIGRRGARLPDYVGRPSRHHGFRSSR